MGIECKIVNERPWTWHDPHVLEDLSENDQYRILQWIANNVFPSRNGETDDSGHLKHQMEHDIGMYVSGNLFKHAMLQSGYHPLEINSIYWDFEVVSIKRNIQNEKPSAPHSSGLDIFKVPFITTLYPRQTSEEIIKNTPPQIFEYPNLLIADGVGIYNGPIPSNHKLILQLPLFRNYLTEILIDDLKMIGFEENRASLKVVLSSQPYRQAMQILGHIAEALIVHRCNDIPEINSRWLNLASFDNSRKVVSGAFHAVGTGLKSTKITNRHLYNPGDTQRDIVWVDEENRLALMKGGTKNAGKPAGLQIKVSGDGTNYLLADLRSGNYEVPIVYFPLNDDFQKIAMQVPGLRTGIDFIDARDIDMTAFREIMMYYPLIRGLLEGTVTPDDILSEARGEPILKNAIFANAFQLSNRRFTIAS